MGRKVDAVKRCCIKELPANLILHLKRFEFDYDTMRKNKLNSRLTFPLLLDLQPFSMQHLSPEGEPLFEPSYFQYELVGVLVHMGSANSGHYYSYVKERKPSDHSPANLALFSDAAISDSAARAPLNWYSFNDTNVDLFDINDLDRECFGGSDTHYQWNEQSRENLPYTIERAHSAYMLFYQRVERNATVVPSFPSPAGPSEGLNSHSALGKRLREAEQASPAKRPCLDESISAALDGHPSGLRTRISSVPCASIPLALSCRSKR